MRFAFGLEFHSPQDVSGRHVLYKLNIAWPTGVKLPDSERSPEWYAVFNFQIQVCSGGYDPTINALELCSYLSHFATGDPCNDVLVFRANGMPHSDLSVKLNLSL